MEEEKNPKKSSELKHASGGSHITQVETNWTISIEAFTNDAPMPNGCIAHGERRRKRNERRSDEENLDITINGTTHSPQTKAYSQTKYHSLNNTVTSIARCLLKALKKIITEKLIHKNFLVGMDPTTFKLTLQWWHHTH